MEFVRNYWEGIVAILALITSAGSTYIAYLTFRLQRTHNIKSVTPILQVGQWDYENVICVDLRNSGAGIAIVKRITVTNKTDESKNCIYDWLPSKLPGTMNYEKYWTGYKDFVLLPNQVIELIRIPIDTSNTAQKKKREEIRSILRQLTIHIAYEDIYNNKMEDKNTELHHFSRTDNEN